MSYEEDPAVQHEEEEDEEGHGYEDEDGDGDDGQATGDASAANTSGGGGGGGKRRKKRAYKKAPDAPRRGRSAYVLFSMDARERVKESLPPGSKVTTVMKEIAAKWRELSEEERSVWITKATEDKTRYEQELSAYDGPLKVPNKRAKKDPLAPKRAMSAFLHFSQSMRPRLRDTYPDAKNVDMSKMLGQEWNRMSEEEKEPYQAKALDDTTRYREAMEAWKQGVEIPQEKEDNGAYKEQGSAGGGHSQDKKGQPSVTAKAEEDGVGDDGEEEDEET